VKLGRRGRLLWSSTVVLRDFSPAELVLLHEACRTSDRLDKLDLILRGDVDTWAILVHKTRTDDYELKIDSALSEARQQANVLRQIVLALTPSSKAASAAPAAEVSTVDALAARRASRGAATSDPVRPSTR